MQSLISSMQLQQFWTIDFIVQAWCCSLKSSRNMLNCGQIAADYRLLICNQRHASTQGLLSHLGRWTHSPPPTESVPKWESGGITPRKFLKIDAHFCAFWGILAQLTDSLDWPVLRQFFQVCDLFPNWSPYANLSLTLKNMKNVLKSDIAIYNYLRKNL